MFFNSSMQLRGNERGIVKEIIEGKRLPKERAGYILAYLALAQDVNTVGSRFRDYAEAAFDALTGDDTAELHVPPLPEDLVNDILVYREMRRQCQDYPDDIAVLLLAAAVDHGSRESFTRTEHELEHFTEDY